MKKILSLLLAVIMVVSLFPVTALATVAETDVAKIGDTGYATLKEAVAAAKHNDTITLLTDVTTDAEKYYGINLASKVITLDLGGYTLSSSQTYAVNIAGAHITIRNGTVKSSGQTAIMVVNGTYTTLTLDSVTLMNTNQNGAHYSLYAQYSGESGSPNPVIIKGDTKFIYNPDGMPQTGEYHIDTGASVSVQAGTYNFDPTSYVDTSKFWVDSTNAAQNEWKVYTLVAAPEAKTGLAETDEEQIGVEEGKGYTLSGVTKAADKGSYTAYATPSEGYVWADNHGTEQRMIDWSIAEASAVAKIGETGYATLARAYNAATNGDTITLLADTTANAETYGITIEKSITLDLDGKTLSSTKYMGVWVKAGNVTIKNGTITGSGTITLAASPAANLMLDSVTLEYTGSNTPYAALNTDCNSLTIKGNTKLLDKDGNVGAFFINSQNKNASVEAGTYNFDPTSYVDSTKFYVDSTSVSGSYIVKPTVAVPVAKAGLVENDTEQIGVEEGEGYTLSGTTKATTAGEYTAYATPATGYVWSDGTTAQKEIKWSIAQSETVAKIGDTEFKTLAGALKAAQSGTGDGKTVTVVGAVNGFTFDGNYDSIIIKGSDTGKITGNFTAAKDASLKNVKFLNLKFEGCGIDFSNVGLQFENAVIQGCTFDGTKIPAEKRQQAITINVHHADKLLIDNNTIKNYTSAGSSGGSSAILLGTVSDFNGFVKGHSVTISNNTIDNIAYNAIQAVGLAKLEITGNTISDTKVTYGPINVSGTEEVLISGNTITLAEKSGQSTLPQGVYYNVNKGIVTLNGNTIKDSAGKTLTFDETLANVGTYVTGTGILVLKGATEADDRYIAVSKKVITDAFTDKIVTLVPGTNYTYFVQPAAKVEEGGNITVGEKDVEVEGTGEGEDKPTAQEAAKAINETLNNGEVVGFADTGIKEATPVIEKTVVKNVDGSGYDLSMILDAVKKEAAKQFDTTVTDDGEITVRTTSEGEDETFTDDDVTKQIAVDLTAATVITTGSETKTVTVTKMTFDVKPIATITVTNGDGKSVTVKTIIPNKAITAPITFRLPVSNNTTSKWAAVEHEGKFMGNYEIKGDNAKYIEVSSKEFSEFGYAIVNEKDAIAKVDGAPYRTLGEAITDVKSGQTITVLKDTDETVIVERAVNFKLVVAEGVKFTGAIKPGDDYVRHIYGDKYYFELYEAGDPIVIGGKKAKEQGEENPDTGAPVMNLGAVAVVLGAAYVLSKKH